MKKLTFFPNGQNVNQIKNKAKYLHKNGEFDKRSSALNSLSESICGLSFNKALEKFSDLSIFELNELWYIPFKKDGFKYYAQVSTKHNRVYLTETMFIQLPLELKLDTLSYSNIEKVDHGYIINIETESDKEYFLELKQTDEGLVVDLIYSFEEDVIDSTYIFYNELMTVESVMKYIDWSNKDSLSDFELSIQLNHTKTDQTTSLFTIHEKYEFVLVGCTTIITPEGDFIYGEDILNLLNESVCSKKELMDFLENNKNIDSLKDYIVNSNPFIEIVDIDSDNENNEIVDSIKKDLYLNLEY